MTKAISTKEKLLMSARALFWTRGYSNVSVRDVTAHAGVDPAMVSRHFDGKLGLFLASLEGASDWPDMFDTAEPDVLGLVVEKFSDADRMAQADGMRMFIVNALDPEVGALIKEGFEQDFGRRLAQKIGGDRALEKASKLMGVMFGSALFRDMLKVEPLASMDTEAYQKYLRDLGEAALG
ncbi:MAG: TetR family transcriptional regulator [Pseudomonadota bacterium]